jgi:hypothetical protein
MHKINLLCNNKNIMSACCGQGVSDLMTQFKKTTGLTVKNHPHDLKPMTTQITPQTFTNTFTKTGFTKFSRPAK